MKLYDFEIQISELAKRLGERMPRHGENGNGNNYTSYSDGSYVYHNSNGSEYASRGNHQHFTSPAGNSGKFQNL